MTLIKFGSTGPASGAANMRNDINSAGRSNGSVGLPSLGFNAGMGTGSSRSTGRPGQFEDTMARRAAGGSEEDNGFRWNAGGSGAGGVGTSSPTAVAQSGNRAESMINAGTEELAESEREALRTAGQSAAAAGVTDPADLQRGQQRVMSTYAGQRANLARDIRSSEAERQAREDMERQRLAMEQQRMDAELQMQRDSQRLAWARFAQESKAAGNTGIQLPTLAGQSFTSTRGGFGGGGMGGNPKNALEAADALGRGLPRFS